MAIKILAPPEQEPVSINEIKQYLRIDWPDDDNLLFDLIAAARQWVEWNLGRALITQTLQSAHYLDDLEMTPLAGVIGGYHGYAVEIPHPPVQSVTTVEIEQQIASWATLDPTNGNDYVVDLDSQPGKVYLATSALAKWAVALNYPGARPRTRITWVAGYGDNPENVPAPIRRNIRQAAAWLYEHRSESAPPLNLLDTTYKVWRI